MGPYFRIIGIPVSRFSRFRRNAYVHQFLTADDWVALVEQGFERPPARRQMKRLEAGFGP